MHMLLLFCTTLPVLVLFLTLQFCSRNKPHNKQYMKQFSQLFLGIFGPFLHLTVKAVVFFSKYLSAECFPNKSCNYDFFVWFFWVHFALHCVLALVERNNSFVSKRTIVRSIQSFMQFSKCGEFFIHPTYWVVLSQPKLKLTYFMLFQKQDL